MKKIARNIIVAVLVLSLTLGIFAGCKKPKENKTLAEKYGITMSDKTVTYDGEKHSIAVSVDNTVLQGKSYAVTYEYGGSVLTKAEFTDAGEYSVTAKVKVDGDDTEYPITNKLTVKKAPLDLEVGNIFLRQGQGLASLGNPRELFKNAGFVGKDTNMILGTLSFEIYNGSSKVNDLSTLKPSTSVGSPYKAKIGGVKELANYDVKLGEGKLYVLIDADYDNAKALKEEIATVPTATTINTYDYNTMRAFASGANHIMEVYPSTTDIQKLMCGTVDVNVVKTLKKTADDRLATVYSLDEDLESAVCEIVFNGANHDRNDWRLKEDKVSEFKDKPSAKKNVEYKDTFAFDVIIYDAVKYKFTNVLINGEEYTPSGQGVKGSISDNAKTGPNTMKYSFGTARTKDFPAKDEVNAPGYGYSATGNPGVIDGIEISNKLLGALDGKTSLIIKPIVGEVFDAGIYKGASQTEIQQHQIGTNADPTTGYPELSNFTITSKGSTDYDIGTGIIESQLVVGRDYKFTIAPLPGYGVVSVEIGDKLILVSQMNEGSFSLKLTEDNISTVNKQKVLKVVPTFEKVYSLAVQAELAEGSPKTLSNTDKDGVFTSNAGTIKLGGVSATKIPTIGQDKIVNLSIKPEMGWLIAGVWVYQGDWNSTNTKKVDITDDFVGVTVIPLDLSEKKFTSKGFVSTEDIKVYVQFRESYPIVVKATYGDKTTTMTSKDGTYSSPYGSVEILNTKKEQISVLSKNGKYFIKLDCDGYVPKTVKLNDKVIIKDGETYDEGVRFGAVIAPGAKKPIVINSSTPGYSSPQAVVPDGTEYDNSLILDTKLAAGEACVIEVEYVAYYYIDLSKSGLAKTECEMDFGTYLTGSGRTYTVSKTPEAHTTGNAKGIKLVFADKRAMINVNDKTFYCYDNGGNLTGRILPTTEVDADGKTRKLVDPRVVMGCNGYFKDTTSAQVKCTVLVEEAVKISKTAADIAKYVSKTPCAPGDSFSISFDADNYE